ncbi:MAG: 4'-phosphopantetheinyl transferase superfamily protein [Desulfurivibrio sp.]|nr:MAG: 4'-phosphopantetheinyl transferase superfamily protein [Desulfurivibrio sp.]
MLENLTGGDTELFRLPPVFPSPAQIIRVNLEVLTSALEAEAGDALALRYLCPQERARLHAFRHEKRKVEWLAGRIAAKCAGLLLQHEQEEIRHDRHHWQQLQVTNDQAGRPYLLWSTPEKSSQVHISISHSSGYAIAMAARENCGIDIQLVTPAVERVEARFACAAEKNILGEVARLHGSQAALTLLWSAKEAVKKSCGRPKLPGFLDIGLQSLQKSGDAYLFAVQINAAECGHQADQQIWVRLHAGFAYAVTMQNQGRT